MNKKILLSSLLLAVCLVVLIGCGIAQESALDGNALTVTDQKGREVVFEEVPQRIISLSPSNTEILFLLGLGDRVVGVTDFCNYPLEAQEKEIIGGFSDPNLERILELEPDMILASTMHPEQVPQLEALGLSVLVVEPVTIADLYDGIALVADVTGVSAEGEAVIASMKQRIAAVQAIVADIAHRDRVSVYYEVWGDPLMSVGGKVMINEIITLAGGVNIFADSQENYPVVSAEAVVQKQPEVVLFPNDHGTLEQVRAAMENRPGWGNIPAVLNGRVTAVVSDVFSRPGPRAVQAIEEAAKIFYPDRF